MPKAYTYPEVESDYNPLIEIETHNIEIVNTPINYYTNLQSPTNDIYKIYQIETQLYSIYHQHTPYHPSHTQNHPYIDTSIHITENGNIISSDFLYSESEIDTMPQISFDYTILNFK
tara:strand:+ start:179 stop:529 length:351 start_codon:yes stop_codon:yes gene_type:complete